MTNRFDNEPEIELSEDDLIPLSISELEMLNINFPTDQYLVDQCLDDLFNFDDDKTCEYRISWILTEGKDFLDVKKVI